MAKFTNFYKIATNSWTHLTGNTLKKLTNCTKNILVKTVSGTFWLGKLLQKWLLEIEIWFIKALACQPHLWLTWRQQCGNHDNTECCNSITMDTSSVRECECKLVYTMWVTEILAQGRPFCNLIIIKLQISPSTQ